MVDQWKASVPTAGTVDLPPDPRALDALGRNHTFETALADLVDNCLDAGAEHVLIRFVQEGNRLVGLYVVDDGQGIAPELIDTTMTVGGRRDYGADDLGHFGIGLKAASFSQAGSLTVLSRAHGHPAVGRRWIVSASQVSYACDVVDSVFAESELRRGWPHQLERSGTVIRWDNVRAFPSLEDPRQTGEFRERTIAHVSGHLGMMFHRQLQRGAVEITIDVEDTRLGLGLPVSVTPLDPFAYATAPAGWPKRLRAEVGGSTLDFWCHIWPGRSNAPEYLLPGGSMERQGLYFYRRGRLLQAGGWEGVHTSHKKLQLARVAVDIDGDLAGLFHMNAEKSRVIAGPEFGAAVREAIAQDGSTIGDYLDAAEAQWTHSNRRATAQRKAVVPPGKGFHPTVRREIRDELPQLPLDPLNVLWKRLPQGEFFQVDTSGPTLWLNESYRKSLLHGRRGGLNDLPVLKAALYLLVAQLYGGSHHGPREKDNIDLWQTVLTAAAEAELSDSLGRL